MENYIGIDWSQQIAVLARLTAQGNEAKINELSPDTRLIRAFLKKLKGHKYVTIEESSASQWLYTELRDCVDELIICDPYRNSLIGDGPKTDKHDAIKLAFLLRGGFLKPVFHSGDKLMDIRRVVSGYEDLVYRGVRLKNQRFAIFQSKGRRVSDDKSSLCPSQIFVLEHLERDIASYQVAKKDYEKRFLEIAKENKKIQALMSIPGFGAINAVKFASIVVDPNRFKSTSGYLSFCGLITLEKMSGGRSYGQKKSRCNRRMKSVLKSAAITAIVKQNPFRNFYDHLIQNKNIAPHSARHATARLIARVALSVMKNERNFDPTLLEKNTKSS